MTVAEEFREEGREDGRYQRTLEITRGMIEKGAKESFILDVLGLSRQELEKLKTAIAAGT